MEHLQKLGTVHELYRNRMILPQATVLHIICMDLILDWECWSVYKIRMRETQPSIIKRKLSLCLLFKNRYDKEYRFLSDIIIIISFPSRPTFGIAVNKVFTEISPPLHGE